MYENQLDFTNPNQNNFHQNQSHNQSHNSFTNNYNSNYYNKNFQNDYYINNNNENYNQSQENLQQTYIQNYQSENYFSKSDENIYIKQNELNNETYARNQQMDIPEQLEYMNQYDINIFPEARPTTLIYNNMTEEKNKKKNNTNKSKVKKNGVGAAWEYNKNFLKNLKNKMKKTKNKTNKKFIGACTDKNCKPTKYEEPQKNFNFKTQGNNNNINNLKNKGLFDPELKTKELDFPRKTQIERMARLEKIKNYDVKFGSQVRKLEVYKNISDMFDDMTFEKEEKDFRKKDKSKKKIGKNDKNFNERTYNIDTEKESKEKFEMKLDFYKAKYVNNLDFNFAHHEQMIKALEDQITEERKMRVDTNMKYLNKMKELEENKLKAFIKATTKNLMSRSVDKSKERNSKGKNTLHTPATNKSQRLMKTYLDKNLNSSSYKEKESKSKKNKYRNNLENSMDLIKKQNNIIDTRSNKAKNSDLVKKAMNDIRPNVDKIVENDFKKIINKVLNKDIRNDNDNDNSQLEDNSEGTFNKMRNYSARGKLNQINKNLQKNKIHKKISNIKKVYNSSRSNSKRKHKEESEYYSNYNEDQNLSNNPEQNQNNYNNEMNNNQYNNQYQNHNNLQINKNSINSSKIN